MMFNLFRKRKIYKYRPYMLRDDINSIVGQMEIDHYKPDVIVGLTRGGLVPAVALAYKLKTEANQFISVTWGRDHRQPSEALFNAYLAGKQILFVDDICDSGNSIVELVSHLTRKKPEYISNLHLAALVNYAGKSAIYYRGPYTKGFKCNYYGRDSVETKGRWVEYFWETL